MSVLTVQSHKDELAIKSTSEIFFEITKQTHQLSSIEYLKKLLNILVSDLQMDCGSINEVVREGQYSLINLVGSHQSKINIDVNQLSEQSLSYLMQEDCFSYSETAADNKQTSILESLPGIKSLISVSLPDANQRTIGMMIFGSTSSKALTASYQEILYLLRSRIGAELERFRLQFALEYARDQSRYISDHSRDMIWNIDTDGIYTYVNPACYEIYGYEPDKMIGQHYSSFIHKNMIEEFDHLVEKNNNSDDVQKLITQHQSANGYPVKLICTTKAVRDRNGQLTGIAGTSTDITEYIRSQLLNKNNNELFSKVLSRLPVIFFRINEDAKLIDIRGRGLERLGVSDMDWVDKSSYGLFKNKDKEVQSVLDGETASFEVSGTVNNQPWSFFVSMFFDSWTGFGAIGFCVDITEQKQNEDKLEKLLNEKRELNQRLVQIQEQERRNLAMELHDEFGQSITAVKSLAKAITAFSGEQYSETRSLSNSIVDLSGKLYEVVNDMMRRLRPEILDTLGLKPAIKNCIERSQLEITGVNCQVSFRGDLNHLDEVITITIYRIVQECLTNISKYAMASNVTIQIQRKKIKTKDRRQREGLISNIYDTNQTTQTRDVIMVTVEDDGIGMDVEQALKVKDHRNRMGLKGIEERLTALGGELEIISEPYKGVKIKAQIEMAVSDGKIQ